MNINWSKNADKQLAIWKKENPRIEKRIQLLIDNIKQTPYEGIGKPEALKHELVGYWSRRIDEEHRLVYCYNEQADTLEIISCKGHY